MNKIYVFFFLCVITLFGIAQIKRVTGPEIETEKKNKSIIQLGTINTHLFTISEINEAREAKFSLNKYDKTNLNLLEKKEFYLKTEFESPIIRWAKIINNRILVIYDEVHKKEFIEEVWSNGTVMKSWKYYLVGQYLTLEGQVIGEPINLADNSIHSFMFEVSNNSAYMVLYTMRDKFYKEFKKRIMETLTLTVYKLDNLQRISEKTLSLFDKSKNLAIEPKCFRISDKAEVCYVSKLYQADEPANRKFTFTSFDLLNNNKNDVPINIKHHEFHSVDFAIKDRKAYGVAYYYRKEKEFDLSGLNDYHPRNPEEQGDYTFMVNLDNKTLGSEVYNKNAKDNNTLNNKTKGSNEKFCPLIIGNVFINDDNSCYSVSQVSSFLIRNGQTYSEQMLDWTSDIVVNKFKPSGDLEWSRKIPYFSGDSYADEHDYVPNLINNKIVIFRPEKDDNWKNFYVKKKISESELDLHTDINGGSFLLVDVFDATGNYKTEIAGGDASKFISLRRNYPYDYMSPYYMHQPFISVDKADIFIFGQDKSKHQIYKLTIN